MRQTAGLIMDPVPRSCLPFQPAEFPSCSILQVELETPKSVRLKVPWCPHTWNMSHEHDKSSGGNMRLSRGSEGVVTHGGVNGTGNLLGTRRCGTFSKHHRFIRVENLGNRT